MGNLQTRQSGSSLLFPSPIGDGDSAARHGRFRQERDMSCNILTVRPLADGKTTVRLQNMSRFSDPPDSNAVDLLWHAETKFHLWP